MSKLLVVLKREYTQIVKKKSFIILTLAMPFLMFAMMAVPAWLARKGMSTVESIAIIDHSGHDMGTAVAESMAEYTMDDDDGPAYTISDVENLSPEDDSQYTRLYDSLLERIVEQRLDYLLVMHAGAHLADSNLLLITNSDRLRTMRRFEYQLSQTLARQRLEESGINIPVDSALDMMRSVSLPQQDTKGTTVNPLVKRFSGMMLMMLIYILIALDGQALMSSVIEEKSNRVIEVLVSSVTPFQLMAGKIVGTGLAALTQVGIWVAAGAGMMFVSGRTGIEIDPTIARVVFNPATVISFVAFLVLGYLFYSTFFAAIGSIVNSEKEARPLLMPIIIILIVPAMFISITAAADSPNADWVRVVSFIPTFTPMVMMMRVAVLAPNVEGNVLLSAPMAEAYTGMASLVVGLFVMLWLTSRIFRVGILMYGKRPTLPEIIKWVRHK